MNRKHVLFSIMIIFLLVSIAGCMPGGGHSSVKEPAGFFLGIWHGWIAPVSLIAGLFNPAIRVYESFNTGWWYDFGFYIALVGGFGGISLIRRKRKE